MQKIKEWLAKANPKEEPDVLDNKEDVPKAKEEAMVPDLAKSGLARSALLSSLQE